jgi:putative spermidine/putrescine transport system substrate-binding protein
VRFAAAALLVCTLAMTASACAGDGNDDPTRIDGLGESLKDIQRRAREEGELNLIVWPRYAHRTWALAFARQTGCAVNATEASGSEVMTELLDSGDWDGVSAP